MMKQQTIWMRCLALGIITSLIILFNSCTKEYQWAGHFYFVNRTGHSISYDPLFQEYNLSANQTLFINQVQGEKKAFRVEDYFSPFLMKRNGPISIRFDGNKCLLDQSLTSEHSPLNIKNYIAEKIDKYTYKFTYTFTEADYNRAVACP